MPPPEPTPTLLASANSAWNISHFRGNLLKALQEEGFAVELAVPDAGSEQEGAWCTHRLPMQNDGLNPIADGLLFWRYLRLMSAVRPAAFLGWTAKPNVYGSLAAAVLRIPALPNVSGLGTAFIRGGALQRLLVGLYRLAFARAPVVYFQNREDLRVFVDLRIVRSYQARLLPGSGVDLARFSPTQPHEIASDTVIFLFVGRILGDKGVRELVEAARLVRAVRPHARFRLLGAIGAANRTAISQEEVDSWVAEGAIEHPGTAADVRPHLAAADAVVLPSYREGLPRSLLEAAAMARPMLASDVPGNREIVEHGRNGLLFAVRSADSLAQACLRFMDMSRQERREMGLQARRTVEERFSEQQVFAAYSAALREVLAARRLAPWKVGS